MKTSFMKTKNLIPVSFNEIPRRSYKDFKNIIENLVNEGGRVISYFGSKSSNNSITLVIAIATAQNEICLTSTDVSVSFESLTPSIPQLHLFEREIFEEFGIRPNGHPWLQPVRFNSEYTDFFKIEGEEIHEVAVGPVHAGVIEPGHFRFQCHGENVYHLEISLGYQHRGVEKNIFNSSFNKILHYMETLAGDTTIGHTMAFLQAIETLSNISVSKWHDGLRAIALELERLANHVGDLGALANDVAFQSTASYCGRLRGEFLNLSAKLCGNRFSRGLLSLGGTNFTISKEELDNISKNLTILFKDVKNAVNLLWRTPSVTSRFENTGFISKKTCKDLGLVGPVARSCGIKIDTRADFPSGIFKITPFNCVSHNGGDVYARAYIRWLEIEKSLNIIKEIISIITDNPTKTDVIDVPTLSPNQFIVSLVEGWRGEICHIAITDDVGHIARYKIVDPSFHNWMGLAMALRNQQISDFPLCNKSFNLSYCGYDL